MLVSLLQLTVRLESESHECKFEAQMRQIEQVVILENCSH
jgi:hypothetical protein